MDLPDLKSLLDSPEGDTSAALSRVEARYRRRRAAKARAAAFGSLLAAATGLGVGLSQSTPSGGGGGTVSATARPAPQPGIRFRPGAVATGALSPPAAVLGSSNGPSYSSSRTGQLCSLLGCSGGMPRTVPVAHHHLGLLEVSAFVATRHPVSGVIEPLSSSLGAAALPTSCGRERELAIVASRKQEPFAVAALPLPAHVAPWPFTEVAETLFTAPHSSEAVLVATGVVSAKVGEVTARFPVAGAVTSRPFEHVAVLAALVPARLSQSGVTLTARSSSGSRLEVVGVPRPARIGVVNGICPQPAG